jgi:hypothetical protein
LEEKEVLYERLGKTIKEIRLDNYSKGSFQNFELK